MSKQPLRKAKEGLNEMGQETPDPTPMAPPVGYKKVPSMFEVLRDMMRSEKLKQEAAESGFETPEEADDFDVGDDYDPSSPYEYNMDPVEGKLPPEIEVEEKKVPEVEPVQKEEEGA